MKHLSDEERLLVQLVHLLAYGDRLEFGLTLSEVLNYLEKPIPRKGNKNAMECLKLEGDAFLKELQDYLSERA